MFPYSFISCRVASAFVLGVALAFSADVAWGCAVCMGAADSTEQQGINAALLTMLGVLGVVFVGISFFVVRMVLCARAANGGVGAADAPMETVVQ